MAIDLLGLIRNEKSSFEQVAAILERDAVLTGRVLRLVQSPLYARRRPIFSLSQAVVRLGIVTLRDAVMEVALNTSIFRPGVFRQPMELVQLHCRATAHISRLVCQFTDQVDDYAFLCGLLHDVGYAGLLITLAEEAAREERLQVDNVVPFWPALDRSHEAATGVMIEIWGLPDQVRRTLVNHHRLTADRRLDPMVAVLTISEHLANQHKCGLFTPSGTEVLDGRYCTPREDLVPRACEVLGIREGLMERLRSESARLVGGLS